MLNPGFPFKSPSYQRMNKKIKLLVAEDHQLYRDAITDFLNQTKIFEATGVKNGLELMQTLEKEKPDVILLDLEMPVMNGNTAFTKIKEKFPGLKIIIFSQYDAKVLQGNFKERGADGYISKNSFADLETVVVEIKRVATGKKRFENNGAAGKTFTKREVQIIPLLCEGKTISQIASQLNISEKSVEKHKYNLFKKTNSENFAQLIKYFCKHGLDFLDNKSKS